MSRPNSPPPVPGSSLTPRVKVWFEAEGGYSFGFGLIEILQAVERAGTIKQAAVALGQSYRHVWGRIKEAERALGHPLVATLVGGRDPHRSALTDPARRLITDFLAMRGRLIDVLEGEFRARPESLKE
jgi:molybdate transport system regulatory protein